MDYYQENITMQEIEKLKNYLSGNGKLSDILNDFSGQEKEFLLLKDCKRKNEERILCSNKAIEEMENINRRLKESLTLLDNREAGLKNSTRMLMLMPHTQTDEIVSVKLKSVWNRFVFKICSKKRLYYLLKKIGIVNLYRFLLKHYRR